MKKSIKFIFAILLFTLLGACNSSDDNTVVNTNKKKVISKITSRFLDYDGSNEFINTEINNFIYKNGNLTKIEVSENYCSNFEYEDSKIINSYGCVNPDEKTIFSYSGNSLIKMTSEEVQNEFFYDSDRLKEVKSSYISDNFTKKYSSKYYFSGNNVSSTSIENLWKTEPTITEYKYDNKNNPFKNHNLFFKLVWGAEFLSDNNVIEEVLEDRVIKYTIIYDSENFPIKSTGIDQKTGKMRTEYTYEYIKI